MAPDTATLIRDGLAPDVDQRAVVVNALLQSLHDAGEASEVQAAWRAEATRRLAEAREGAVELVDADEHYEHLRASLTTWLWLALIDRARQAGKTSTGGRTPPRHTQLLTMAR